MASFFKRLAIKIVSSLDLATEPTPPLPRNMNVRVSPQEKEEVISSSHTMTPVIGQAFGIRYVNAAGEVSERRITVRRIGANKTGDIMLYSYCHERKAPRSFKTTSIKELIDLQTGEVLPDPVKFWKDNYIDTPEKKKDSTFEILKHCKAPINILCYIAWADGNFHDNERKKIADFVFEQAGKKSSQINRSAIEKYISRLHPDSEVFKESIKQIPEMSKKSADLLGSYIYFVAQADGQETPEEGELIHQILDAVIERVTK